MTKYTKDLGQDDDNKIRERILKLYNLVKNGIGGEKKNARKILDKLLAKHGIILSEIIDDEHEETFIIKFKGVFEKKLLNQIIGKVRNRETQGFYYKGKLHFNVTKLEYAEILTLFSVYKNALSREFDNLFLAFIHKQKIFPNKDSDNQVKKSDRTETQEERLLAKKLISMMSTIDKIDVYKSIEAVNCR